MNRNQLEIGFENKPACPRPVRRRRRMARASWWFGQMRRVVDHTLEWQPLAATRPEQAGLTLQRVKSG